MEEKAKKKSKKVELRELGPKVTSTHVLITPNDDLPKNTRTLLPQTVQTQLPDLKKKRQTIATTNQADAEGEYQLALSHLAGVGGLEENKSVAIRYLKRATEKKHKLAKEKLIELLPIADRQDPEDRYTLASCYEHGINVEKDIKEAIRLYQSAAQEGYARASFRLGLMHEDGLGVQQDIKEAIRYYQMSAEKKFYGALNNLATLYKNGQGVAKNPTRAIGLYQEAMAQGSVSAIYNLSMLYLNGKSVKQDIAEGLRLLKLAANQGDKLAQFQLGGHYYRGKYVSKDLKEAARFYQMAADQQYPAAECNLAKLYEQGRGVPQDLKKAAQYYALAAFYRNVAAQNNLGRCYLQGIGVPRDVKQAVLIYEAIPEAKLTPESKNNLGEYYILHQQKDKEAQAFKLLSEASHYRYDAEFNLAYCYEKGLGVSQDREKAIEHYKQYCSTLEGTEDDSKKINKVCKRLCDLASEQKSQSTHDCLLNFCHEYLKDPSETFKYVLTAAESGNPWAQNTVGKWLETGDESFNLPQDKKAAVQYYGLAAQRNVEAAHNLVRCYQQGIGLERDMEKAADWCGHAAELGDVEAQNEYGIICEQGKWITKDLKKAVRFYSLAAHKGDAEAQYRLANCLATGSGVSRDIKEAANFYRLAADKGHIKAQFKLAVCYEHGIGVKRDLMLAIALYKLTADQEDPVAQYHLASCYLTGLAEGVLEQDLAEAKKYFGLSAQQGNAEAKKKLASLSTQPTAWFSFEHFFGNSNKKPSSQSNHSISQPSALKKCDQQTSIEETAPDSSDKVAVELASRSW